MFDARIARHAIVDARPPVVYRAALELDFLQVRTPLLTASMWVRGLPMRLSGRPQPPPPPRLTLSEESSMPGWMSLGRVADREIAFGAVGVFWTPDIRWNEAVDAEHFAAFAEPGWGKIACNFTTFEYGESRTLLTYECRTFVTDPESRHKFLRYWTLIRPFVGHIMGATVRTVRAQAEMEASP